MYGGESMRYLVCVLVDIRSPESLFVSILAQLRSAMLYKFLDGSFQVIGTGFGFKFWTVVPPVRGKSNL